MNNIKEALTSLWHAKQRSLLALLGITIGIASVIAMVTVGAMVEREAMKQFEALGTDFVNIMIVPTGSSSVIPDNLAFQLKRHSKSVKDAVSISSAGSSMYFSNQPIDGSFIGSEQGFDQVNRLKVKEGRMISSIDGRSPFCVLGADVAAQLTELGEEVFLGKEMRVGHRIYTIIGTLERTLPNGLNAIDPNSCVIAPIPAVKRQSAFAAISQVLARVDLSEGSQRVKDDIKLFFSERIPGFDVQIMTAEALITQMEKQSRMFTLMMGAIGSISLIVGGVGVMNVMLVSVSERRKEIGLRRAIGATRPNVQFQFLVESVVLCLLGGLLGVLFGTGSAYIIAKVSLWEFFVPLSAVLIGVCVSSFTGIFFGFYPAKQASQLDIIECLRAS